MEAGFLQTCVLHIGIINWLLKQITSGEVGLSSSIKKEVCLIELITQTFHITYIVIIMNVLCWSAPSMIVLCTQYVITLEINNVLAVYLLDTRTTYLTLGKKVYLKSLFSINSPNTCVHFWSRLGCCSFK